MISVSIDQANSSRFVMSMYEVVDGKKSQDIRYKPSLSDIVLHYSFRHSLLARQRVFASTVLSVQSTRSGVEAVDH